MAPRFCKFSPSSASRSPTKTTPFLWPFLNSAHFIFSVEWRSTRRSARCFSANPKTRSAVSCSLAKTMNEVSSGRRAISLQSWLSRAFCVQRLAARTICSSSSDSSPISSALSLALFFARRSSSPGSVKAAS